MSKKVYWDKGHEGVLSGMDPGAIGNGLKEAELVSKIINYADAHIKANYDGVVTKMSRTGNKKLTLTERTNDANAWGADVFISAHINAFNGDARGFESFRHPNAGNATASLQNVVHREIVAAIAKFGSVPDRNQKTANFHVLRESRMSAVLTETLFIDNRHDAALLKQDAFLKAVGVAHAVGVATFLGLKRKAAPAPTPQPTNNDAGVMFRVVTGSFSDRSNAEKRISDLKKAGFDSFIDIKRG